MDHKEVIQKLDSFIEQKQEILVMLPYMNEMEEMDIINVKMRKKKGNGMPFDFAAGKLRKTKNSPWPYEVLCPHLGFDLQFEPEFVMDIQLLENQQYQLCFE